MFAKVRSIGFSGLEVYPLEVEVDIQRGLPGFDIVGLPDKAVREARERVRSALRNCGWAFPLSRITVNLSPANIRKAGPIYDLPIAIGILLASQQLYLSDDLLDKVFFLGELSLSGDVSKASGLYAAALYLAEMEKQFILCAANFHKREANAAGIPFIGLTNLSDLRTNTSNIILPSSESMHDPMQQSECHDNIFGQEQAKKAVTIAAAGGHHLLLQGPPGVGKTMLARLLANILPGLSDAELIEVNRIYSLSGITRDYCDRNRPFRSPHHTSGKVSMIGSASQQSPGEITLAHRGVLFLDEVSEFARDVLEALRQPLEEGKIILGSAKQRIEYPAAFQLVAARNLCPCGKDRDDCECTPARIEKYRNKISGPILDRIDLAVELYRPSYKEINNNTLDDLNNIRIIVQRAREQQIKRYGEKHLSNASVPVKLFSEKSSLSKAAQELLDLAYEKFKLSMRGYWRVARIARTIADLESSERVQEEHMAIALQYRILNEKI